MKPVYNRGFTIVEVMLFLGISGLLFYGLMIGTSGSINTQRYRDSVSSLQSILQKQYNEANNVINDSANVPCLSSNPRRGQSDCVVLGKFITTRDSSGALSDQILSIKNVIGTEPPSSTPLTYDDLDDIPHYNIIVSNTDSSIYELEWGTSLSTTGASPVSKYFSMLILRSPTTGQTRTFLNDDPTPTAEGSISSMIAPAYLNHASIRLCVDSKGMDNGKMLAVSINSLSTGPSGIEILSKDIGNPCQ